jgi:hypothetical protein
MLGFKTCSFVSHSPSPVTFSSQIKPSFKRWTAPVLLMLALTACGGGSSTPATSTTTHTIGGSLTGLTSGSVVLQKNSTNDLTLSANGSFSFTTSVDSGSAYAVTVLTQPIDQSCVVSSGSGTVAASDISNVAVNCVDATAPAARITFPTPFSATEGDSIIVRGTASDPNEITVVRVNGIDAISSDNFATWQAPLALTPGLNDLTVETGDIALNGNMAATSARINAYGVAFGFPNSAVLDSVNNRALVVDQTLKALVAVDLTTGARTMFSDSSFPDGDNAFGSPQGVVLDSANNRALVIDDTLKALMAVDLTTGARTIVSDSSKPLNGGNAFSNLRGVELDSANNRALDIEIYTTA